MIVNNVWWWLIASNQGEKAGREAAETGRSSAAEEHNEQNVFACTGQQSSYTKVKMMAWFLSLKSCAFTQNVQKKKTEHNV